MYKVVVADDEPKIRRGIKKMLESFGLNLKIVGVAQDGIDALNLIKAEKPDIVLVDINMPFLNGFSLIEESIQIVPECIIIIITGYDEFKYAQKAVRLGIFDYLLKPIDHMELYDVMVKAMNESCKKTRERHLVELLEKELDENRQHSKKESNNIITEVTNYLKQNYNDGNLNLKDVAEKFYINPSHLTRIMKSRLGLSFIEYLTELRLNHAIKILETAENDVLIYEVAKMVGYNSQHYFSRIFKNKTGFSPKEYRSFAKYNLM